MTRNNQNILIVEDSADDEELMLFALEKSGVKKGIIILRDGADAADFTAAVGMFSDRGADDMPQIVFLDYKLPGMTGLEVLKRIRSNDSTVTMAVIIMTTSTEQTIEEESIRLGASGFVHKSQGLDEFVDAVKRQLIDYCGPTP